MGFNSKIIKNKFYGLFFYVVLRTASEAGDTYCDYS